MRLFLLIMLSNTLCYSQVECKCNGGEGSFIFKNIFAFCGTISAKQSNSFFISEFSLKNCKTGAYLLDERLNAITTFLVKIGKDSAVLTEMQLVPDSLMLNLNFVPLKEQIIEVENKTSISQPKFVFEIPKLNSHQTTYLDSLCGYLKSKIMPSKIHYPADEFSIYCLFLGALSKHGDCYDLLTNINNYFTLDGAIAETMGEIPFKYIVDNYQR